MKKKCNGVIGDYLFISNIFLYLRHPFYLEMLDVECLIIIEKESVLCTTTGLFDWF